MKCFCFGLLWALSALYARAFEQWPKCDQIRSPICLGLGYNTTMMPNFVGHKTMEEAEKGVSIHQNLLNIFSDNILLFIRKMLSQFLRIFINVGRNKMHL